MFKKLSALAAAARPPTIRPDLQVWTQAPGATNQQPPDLGQAQAAASQNRFKYFVQMTLDWSNTPPA